MASRSENRHPPAASPPRRTKFYGAEFHGKASQWLVSFAPITSVSTSALAEEFPNRPITWVVPFAPGGITDTTSRIVAEEMSRTLGQSVLIDNRGGGGGTVGTEQVARSRPDGYTMIYGTQGTMAANVTLRKTCPMIR
jgi:tripartite-type tricarboxylate transporter receptor subunit TctC